MLKDMDNIQFTAMSFPKSNYMFSDQQWIDASVMKLKGMEGMYKKDIEKWGWVD